MNISLDSNRPPTKAAPAARAGRNDFRDHLATADAEGRRQWIYPRQPEGPWYRARTWLSYLLLLVMFVGPFVRINGNPLLLINVVERKFVIFGQVFWPQDALILAVGLLAFITGIVLFTAAFGRLWCGWACPQTVLMEMVFRKIEYAIEGGPRQQRENARPPWTLEKLTRKLLKHVVFFGLSFVIGNTLLAYIIGADELFKIITDDPRRHLQGLALMLLFTAIFYGIFARFREQACTFICPYGRLQSTLLDDNSIVVAYDYKRGERRGPWPRGQGAEARAAAGLGDCVDCRQCVAVCPTGIDIRNGTQMECVHCTACMDACDQIMRKIGRPAGLVRYASENGILHGQKLKVTPRMVVYSLLLLLLVGLETTLLLTRSDLDTTFLRAPGALFQQMPGGQISNLYVVKLINKTSRPIDAELRLENLTGKVSVLGPPLRLAPGQLSQASVLVELDPAQLRGASTPLLLGVYAEGRRLQKLKTVFMGPRHDLPPQSKP